MFRDLVILVGALSSSVWLLTFPAWPQQAEEALILFEENDRFGYRSGDGKVVIEPRYHVATEFSAEGIAAVADDKAWAYIDRAGRLLLRPFVVDNGPDSFREGLARFTSDGRFGFFDRHGRIVIGARFDFATPFAEGRAGICAGCEMRWQGEHRFWDGGKWGFIDPSGKIVIPVIYDEILGFRNGTAKVRHADEWLELDKRGNLVASKGTEQLN